MAQSPSCSLPYPDFSKAFHEKTKGLNIPVSGTFEITTHCNFDCLQCYIRDNSSRGELSTMEIKGIIDEITEAGCLWILFTGGEIFTRRDFLDIYRYAKERGLLITLFTNGTLITEETARFLGEYRPFSTEITLYGSTEETYEQVTGRREGLKETLEAINRLLNHKIPLKLKSTIIRENKEELEEMERMAHKLGLPFRYDSVINPTFRGSLKPCSHRLSPMEVVALDYNREARHKEWERLDNSFTESFDRNRLFNCEAGKGSFHITPRGELQICGMVRSPSFDLRQTSFKEAYGRFGDILSEKPKEGHPCTSCDIAIFCDSCPGWSQLEKGDKNARVDYLCDIAHSRAQFFRKKGATDGAQSLFSP